MKKATSTFIIILFLFHLKVWANGNEPDSTIVMGYQSQNESNISSAIVYLEEAEFNPGMNINPVELIIGKTTGMSITRQYGSPGSNHQLTIRGISTLLVDPGPLFVLDGVILDQNQVNGMRSTLNFINPGDISSITILKDAGANAIYGGRASNGVILINTKKGDFNQPFQVRYEGKFSFSSPRTREVLSTDEYRLLVKQIGTDEEIALMGSSNTDWQKEIHKNAFGQDHIVSLTGGLKNLPYYFSLGYSGLDGVLKTDRLERFTGDLKLNPRFFKKHLGLSADVKVMSSNNRFADPSVITGAFGFDPTQSVFDSSSDYGGYFLLE